MTEVKIGICSICNGDVVAYRGGWMSTLPYPGPKCSRCGAVAASDSPVIPMVKPLSLTFEPHKVTKWDHIPLFPAADKRNLG